MLGISKVTYHISTWFGCGEKVTRVSLQKQMNRQFHSGQHVTDFESAMYMCIIYVHWQRLYVNRRDIFTYKN